MIALLFRNNSKTFDPVVREDSKEKRIKALFQLGADMFSRIHAGNDILPKYYNHRK